MSVSLRDDFILLGCVTTVSKTLQAPLERIKLLVQCQQEIAARFQSAVTTFSEQASGVGAASGPHTNLSARQMLRLVMKDERYPTTLFRGNLWNVVRFVPSQVGLLAVRDALNAKLLFPRERGYKKWLFTSVLSGGLAGVFSQILTHPFDFLRTRLAVDLSGPGAPFEQKNGREVVTRLIRSQGIRALYTGFLVGCGGIFVYRGIYFALYDALRELIQPSSVMEKMAIGWISSFVGTVLAYPFDTVRRRMICGVPLQLNSRKRYKNAWLCFQRIVGREGMTGLFRGSSINVLRHVTGAAVLVAYDVYLAAATPPEDQKVL